MLIKRLPILSLLAILTGIYLSIMAGVFSISGMMALFSASAISVCLMMIGLETAKVVASCILKFNRTMKIMHRAYLVAAVVILMVITAVGVYGHLAKGHLEQQAPLGPIQLQLAQGDARVAQLKQQLAGLATQQNQINASVDAVIKSSQSARDARSGLRAQTQSSLDRKAIQDKIDSTNNEINRVTQSLVPLRVQSSEVTAKLGPIQYIADAFGWKDPETAVRIIILMLMSAFDPLALVLLIVGVEKLIERPVVKISDEPLPVEETIPQGPEVDIPVEAVVEEPMDEAVEEPDEEITSEPEAIVEPIDESEPEPDPEFDDLPPYVPVPTPKSWGGVAEPTHLLNELEEIIKRKEDRQSFLDMLERHPEFIDEVIKATEEVQEEQPRPVEWLSPQKPKGE